MGYATPRTAVKPVAQMRTSNESFSPVRDASEENVFTLGTVLYPTFFGNDPIFANRLYAIPVELQIGPVQCLKITSIKYQPFTSDAYERSAPV